MSAGADARNIRLSGGAVNPAPGAGRHPGGWNRLPGRHPLMSGHPFDHLPDVRDGLTRAERIILHTLYRLEQERPGRAVPTAQLYGHVVEQLDISPDAFQALL